MALKKAAAHPELREVTERVPARDEQGLRDQLQHAEAGHRRKAAIDLRDFPDSVFALGAALVRESDGDVRSAILMALSHIANEPVVDVLLPLLRSESAALRNGAIEALARMESKLAPSIPALLQDPDPDVRLMTLQLLAEFAHPGVRIWLRELLVREQDTNVLAAAMEVMAEVGETSDLELLRTIAKRDADDGYLGFIAETAIKRIQTV